MDDVRLHTEDMALNRDDVIPGERLVADQVKCLSDGGIVPHQPHKAFGKVGVVGDSPERFAVAVDDHRRAPQHPVRIGPLGLRAGKGHDQFGTAIGMRRPDHSDRKILGKIFGKEPGFRIRFLLGIIPKAIAQRHALSDRMAGDRLSIGGSGGNEDILTHTAAQQFVIPLRIGRGIGDKVGRRIKFQSPESRLGRLGIIDVGDQILCTQSLQRPVRAPVQEIKLYALGQSEFRNGGTDQAGTADK